MSEPHASAARSPASIISVATEATKATDPRPRRSCKGSRVLLSVVAPGARPGSPAGGLGHGTKTSEPRDRTDRGDDATPSTRPAWRRGGCKYRCWQFNPAPRTISPRSLELLVRVGIAAKASLPQAADGGYLAVSELEPKHIEIGRLARGRGRFGDRDRVALEVPAKNDLGG